MNNPNTSKMASDSHIVGGGFTVRFSILGAAGSSQHIQCQWPPRQPSAKEFNTKVDARKYDAALQEFISAVVGRVGDKHG